jgi:hypothetical protein
MCLRRLLVSQAQFEASVLRVQTAINHLNDSAEDLRKAKAAEAWLITDKLIEQVERIRTFIILLRHSARLVETPEEGR